MLNKQSKLSPKGTKKRTSKTKASTKKLIIKIREEMNKIETKEKINDSKSWCFEKKKQIDKLLVRFIIKRREGPKQHNQKWKRRS